MDEELAAPTRGPLVANLLTGGLSNLTYQVTDGESTWVVRRPPLGNVLQTAHDMAREYRFITALQTSDVPVPKTFALGQDDEVLGAPFYIMEYVEGTCFRQAISLVELSPARISQIATNMIHTLVAVHEVDLASTGLVDAGKPNGYLQRQIRRWSQQWEKSRTRDLPDMDRLAALLADRVPVSAHAALVHGDYRWDNLLVNAHDDVVAVIDWEMATIGDPFLDLGLLVVYTRLSQQNIVVGDICQTPGFLNGDSLLERYFAQRNLTPIDMGFYVGLASFKLAVIFEGIYRRHQEGHTVGEGFDGVGAVVQPLLVAGIEGVRS